MRPRQHARARPYWPYVRDLASIHADALLQHQTPHDSTLKVLPGGVELQQRAEMRLSTTTAVWQDILQTRAGFAPPDTRLYTAEGHSVEDCLSAR